MYSASFGNWWLNVALVALLAGLVLAGGPPPQTISRPISHLAPERSPAEASRTYFQVASQVIDQMTERIERCLASAAPAISVLCLRQAVMAIDQVPTDNVDPELVQWGTETQRQMNQAARECMEAEKQMLSRLKSSQTAHQIVTPAEHLQLRKQAGAWIL